MSMNRIWTIGTAIVLAAVLVLGWLLVVSPTVTQADAAREQTAAIDAQNAAQQRALVTLKAQAKALPKTAATLATLRKAIPGTGDLDTFLDELQTMATSSGVVLTSFTASAATSYGADAGTASAPAASAAPTPSPSASASEQPNASAATVPSTTTPATGQAALAGKLFTIPVTLSVQGNLAQVTDFVRKAQENSRYFLLPTMTLNATGVTTLTGSVFVLREAAAG